MDPMIPSDEIDVDNRALLTSGDNSGLALKGTWRDATVAIKRLPQESTLQAVTDFVRRYKAIKHEHVQELLGGSAFEPGPAMCLITPYLENGNVKQYLEANPDLSPLKLVAETAIGMEYLHSKNIIHGRLKPTNVLVSNDGHALITDVGLYQFSGVPSAASYLSPESWKGKVSKQSDVYAFAMVMYEMYTMGPPWGFLSDSQVYQLVVREGERPDRPDEDATHPLSDYHWGIVETAWNVNPSTRPKFSQIVSNLSQPAPTPSQAAPQPQQQPQPVVSPPQRSSSFLPPRLTVANPEAIDIGLTEAEAELGALSLSLPPPAYDSPPPDNPVVNPVNRPAPIVTYEAPMMMASQSAQPMYTPPSAQSVFIPPKQVSSYYPDEKRRPPPGQETMGQSSSYMPGQSSSGYQQQQSGRRLPQTPPSVPNSAGLSSNGQRMPYNMMGSPSSTPPASEDQFPHNRQQQQPYYVQNNEEMALGSPHLQRFGSVARPMMNAPMDQQQAQMYQMQQQQQQGTSFDRRMSMQMSPNPAQVQYAQASMRDPRMSIMSSTPPPIQYVQQAPMDPRMSVVMTSPQPHLQRFNSTATRPMGAQSSYAPSVMSSGGGSVYQPEATSAAMYAQQTLGPMAVYDRPPQASTASSGPSAVRVASAIHQELAEGRKRETIDEYLLLTQELVSQSEKETQKFITAGIIPNLVLLVKTRAADGQGIEIVLKTLGMLAHDPLSANTIFRTNAAMILFEIIALSGNQDATALSIWVLSRVSRSAEIASGLIKNDLVSLLLRNGLTGSGPTAQIAAWCLGNLIYTDSQADTLVSQGVIPAVVSQLRKLLDSRTAQPDDICAILYAIARVSRSIKLAKLLHRSGCVEPLMECFLMSEDPDVLMWSARAIGCLMRPNSGDMAKILLEAGAAKGLARLPQIIPSDSIMPLGSFAFAIARFSCAEWGSSTRKQLVEAGVVDSLLAALRTAADVPFPQVHIELALAVSFLGDVGGGDLRKEIVRAGGIEILKGVAANGNPQVAKTCNMAITSITGNIWTRNAASAKTAMNHDWSGGCPDHQPPCPTTTSTHLYAVQAPN
ncbi:hypothetical protein FRB94_010496 [Tulasnella sp. JGI-2019a]|nr:hypothetical protein FRB93_003146 [Tulasnella sp. JGI-2019a]KAG8993645.1 hypothetical protein FRB94_010496 [Tulasnella sp. JGI-2019a]